MVLLKHDFTSIFEIHPKKGKDISQDLIGQYTRFTDAGAPSGLSWTSREVMTTMQGEVLYVFEHKTR